MKQVSLIENKKFSMVNICRVYIISRLPPSCPLIETVKHLSRMKKVSHRILFDFVACSSIQQGAVIMVTRCTKA
jgi:hypothetical protein